MLEPGRHPRVWSLEERLGDSSLSDDVNVAARIAMRGIGGVEGSSSGTGDLGGNHLTGALVAQKPFIGRLVNDTRRGVGATGSDEGGSS